MESKEARRRMRILEFWQKYGIDATIEAFGVSRRTLYRWRKTYEKSGEDPLSLNPKPKTPKRKRTPAVSSEIVSKIRELRKHYPNLGKAKLHVMLKPWCEANGFALPSESTIGRVIARDKEKMRLIPCKIDRNGKRKPIKPVQKTRKPRKLTTPPMHLWAVDTIQKVSDGIRRYIMTMIDPYTRIAFAVALPTKHAKHTTKALKALIDGVIGNRVIQTDPKSFAVLSDNGSEFMKEFDALLKEKGITHYWTYPKSPKMNAHNERFNRTLQEQFVNFYEDLLFTDIDLFNQMMAEWLIDYNTKIPHHSLQMKTPVQFLIEKHPECHMLWTYTGAILRRKNVV